MQKITLGTQPATIRPSIGWEALGRYVTDAQEAAAAAEAAAAGATAPTEAVVTGLLETPGSGPRTVLDAAYARSKSTAAEETATLGPELVTSTGWTLGTGWTGDLATGFTFTGSTYGLLEWTPPEPTGTKTYMVEFVVDSAGNSSEFTVTVGGSFGMVMYEGATGGTHTYSRGIQSVANGNLVFTPMFGFSGSTIRAVSMREVTASFDAPTKFTDSTGATAIEVRPTEADQDNIFVGKDVGRFNTTGHENVAIGNYAMRMSTSGFWNVAIGDEALSANTNGTRNVAIGFLALHFNLTGHRNIAAGPFALYHNTHGKGNIALGADTAWLNETGDYNIAFGQAALGESHSGDSNVAIGRAALGHANGMSNHIAIGDYASWELNSEGDGKTIAIGQRALRNATKGGNLAIGDYAGNAVTTGTGHTIVGHEAGKMVTTATNVTYIGRYAGRDVTGQYNTAVGMNAMGGTAAGNAARNTAVGYGTLTSLQAGGDYNVAIGSSAGATITTGQSCILIGYNAQSIGPTDSNYLNIGNTIHGYMSGTKRIGLGGVTNPTAALHVRAGVAGAGGAPMKFTTGGALLTTPEPGAFEFDGTDLYITTATGVRKKVTAA